MSNIVLLGYRGSGKTSLGKGLAKQTWKEFVDIDEQVCARFGGATIAEIWETHGEVAFREAEAEATQAAMAGSDQVIALGGGTVMHPAARAAVEGAANARRIYLHCRAATLSERIAGDPASAAARPSLTDGSASAADPDEIAKVLEVRDPVYRAVADVVLDVTYLDTAGVLSHVMRTCA